MSDARHLEPISTSNTNSGADNISLKSPGWADSLSTSDLFEQKRIKSIAKKTFTTSNEAFMVVDLHQDGGNDGQSPRVVVRGPKDQQALLSDHQGARVRIVFIHAATSAAPLRIRYETVCQMWEHYKLEPEFCDIVTDFGDGTTAGYDSSMNGFLQSYEDKSQACGYLVRYFEEDSSGGVGSSLDWRERQTAVYHRHSPGSKATEPSSAQPQQQQQPKYSEGPFDLFILLSSTPRSRFATEIRSIWDQTLAGQAFSQKVIAKPFLVHDCLTKIFMSNWTWYLRDRVQSFQEKRNPLFTTHDPKTKLKDLQFEALGELRFDHDNISIAASFCQSSNDVLSLLQTFRERFELCPLGQKDDDQLRLERQARGHARGFELLLSRISNALALLEYMLDLKTQYISSDMNSSMVEMTQYTVELSKAAQRQMSKAADDSAAIRIITILTLVYLPGTFVSGIFGSNFFDFNAGAPNSDAMAIANNFWIYIVLWVPLTLLTISIYLFINRRRKQQFAESMPHIPSPANTWGQKGVSSEGSGDTNTNTEAGANKNNKFNTDIDITTRAPRAPLAPRSVTETHIAPPGVSQSMDDFSHPGDGNTGKQPMASPHFMRAVTERMHLAPFHSLRRPPDDQV